MKSIDEIIAATVEKTVGKALQAQRKQLQGDIAAIVRQELANMSTANAPTEERLLTRKEAASRLIVSVTKLDELIGGGEITQVNTPGGRDKIVESSLNAYIVRLGNARAAR